MAQASSLSRYQPTVIAATSVAVFYAAYYLYATYSEQSRSSRTTLHRSNAVHRAHGERRRTGNATTSLQPHISYRPPTDEAPLGYLWVETDSNVLETNLATRGMPDDLDNQFYLQGVPLPNFQSDICIASIECVLQASLYAINPRRRERLARMGLEGLPEAMAERNIDIIRGFASNINTVLPLVTPDQIETAIVKFSTTEIFATGAELSVDADNDVYAETDDADGVGAGGRDSEPSHGLKGLLYHIAEADAKRKAYEHRGIQCEECNEMPIRGVRWHCLNCPDFDLCSTCEANTEHTKTHVMAKIKIPLPILAQPTKEYPLWYPGDPRKFHTPLHPGLRKRLQDDHDFDASQIDAMYDQFSCIANVPYLGDHNNIKSAIDRRAFNKALTSERWPLRIRMNALYDRMFAFYDTDMNGLIGFEEFISGIAYIRGPKRYANLHRALQGFDLDGDGYVDRNDFIVLFRAKHEVQKLLVGDMVDGRETEQTNAAMETLRSSQPISSVFQLEDIPLGQERPRTGKAPDRHGDMQPLNGSKTVLEDREGLPHPAFPRLTNAERVNGGPSHHLSRFEELLGSPEEDDAVGHSISNNIAYIRASDSNVNPNAGVQQHHLHRPHLLPQVDGHDDDNELSEDFLWRLVEFGLREMLDPLFQEHEKSDQRAIDSRAHRELYEDEMAEVVRQRSEAKQLDAAAAADPLWATMMNSTYNQPSVEAVQEPTQLSAIYNSFAAELVPTDPASLEDREKSIAEKPLEDLLDESGYSVIADSNDAVHRDSVWSSPAAVSDPTMPQNRPTSTDSTSHISSSGAQNNATVSTDGKSQPKEPICRDYAQHLISLHERDREMKARGGFGKMSYAEILESVEKRGDGSLRGLVTSWLEWASF